MLTLPGLTGTIPTMSILFGGKVYIIPKRNFTLKGSQKWKDIMKEFVQNTMVYLAVPSEEQFRSRLRC